MNVRARPRNGSGQSAAQLRRLAERRDRLGEVLVRRGRAAAQLLRFAVDAMQVPLAVAQRRLQAACCRAPGCSACCRFRCAARHCRSRTVGSGAPVVRDDLLGTAPRPASRSDALEAQDDADAEIAAPRQPGVLVPHAVHRRRDRASSRWRPRAGAPKPTTSSLHDEEQRREHAAHRADGDASARGRTAGRRGRGSDDAAAAAASARSRPRLRAARGFGIGGSGADRVRRVGASSMLAGKPARFGDCRLPGLNALAGRRRTAAADS